MKALGGLLTPLRLVGWMAGVAGTEKSFSRNPLLGNAMLNRWGLHEQRVRLAAVLARLRRRRLARLLDPADVAALERDGLLIKPDLLPPETFARLREEVFGRPHPAWERRQGEAATRMIAIDGASRAWLPVATAIAEDTMLRRLVGYAGGRSGMPLFFVQIVLVDPGRGAADPQTDLHADTFHPTAKLWLFLDDVGAGDGPLVYAVGSHRPTPERLDWEYRQSLSASIDGRSHHADGSFRTSADDIVSLGYRPPAPVTVSANTLVIADTFGFHGRARSLRPTRRTAIHAYLRRNPFAPWNGLDMQALPGIRGRQWELFTRYEAFRERHFGRRRIWTDAGEISVDAPPCV